MGGRGYYLFLFQILFHSLRKLFFRFEKNLERVEVCFLEKGSLRSLLQPVYTVWFEVFLAFYRKEALL